MQLTIVGLGLGLEVPQISRLCQSKDTQHRDLQGRVNWIAQKRKGPYDSLTGTFLDSS